MKTAIRFYTRILRASLSIVLTTPFLNASAQSGRVVPAPQQPTPNPTSRDTLTKQSDARPKLVIDPGADEYKLVFPAGYEGKRFYRMDKERKELARATRSELSNFIEQLNKAGEQGYKLTSAVYRGFPVGIAKYDEVRHEYEGFDTTSNFFFALGGFGDKYAELSRRGFRLADHFLISKYCEYIDPDNSGMGENCEFIRRFLFEREKGVEKPSLHVLVGSGPGWRAKPGVELSTRIKEELAQGFYPTSVLSKFEILLEQTTKNDKPLTDKLDVRVVTSSSRDDVKDKVNELAKQGYRLALTNNGIAVMYRNGDPATPVTYVWLKAKDKSFEKQLSRLQESGAFYRMTYPDDDGEEARLVFEQQPVDEGQRREYKVLKFEFQSVANAAEGKVHLDLAPSSKDTMKMLNRLVKEGFAVRDLFVSDEVSVILERPRL